MAISISVIDILNEDHQLESLPVGENLRVLFSEQPDTYRLENYISIVRISNDQDVPNLGDLFVHQIIDGSSYDTIECEYIPVSTEIGYGLIVNPEEFLVPNANYYLVIGKGLAPLYHYSVNKTVSTGPSTLVIETNTLGTSEDAVYTITVSSQSNLSNGHDVSFDVSKDGGFAETHDLDLKSNPYLDLNNTVAALFDPNIPYMLGETFEVTLQEIVRLPETKIQKFSTLINSDVIENVDETSTRLSQEDILDYYESTEWSAIDTPAEVAQEVLDAVFIYPNIIKIKLPTPIEPTSLVEGAFDIDVSYAFGNYLLPQMGFYKESDKYIISFSLNTSNDTITLEINKDTEALVPENDKYILQGV